MKEGSPDMFHFGFSYIGLIWLLMLFIPNIIWTRNKPLGYDEAAKKENRVLLIFEKIGQVLVTVLVLIFSDFDIDYRSRSVSSLIVLGISFLLMICYELYWVRYFKSEKTVKDFYSSFLGIPVAGATLPVLAFFVLGLYGSNSFLLFAVTVLGIGHIGIHLQHKNEAVKKEKTKLSILILKIVVAAIGSILVLVAIGYFGIKNVKFVRAFVGAPKPVFEDCYIDLNGQEQFIRVMGRDTDNPVIILLHGGPASPDGMMDYACMDYLLDDYTYITWDQRGCGRTYYRNHSNDPENSTATDEQILLDIDALVDYACNRFGKDKVTILGHSWGTILACQYSQLHSEKIDKTICIGQVFDFLEGDTLAYEHARDAAVAKGDDTSAMEDALNAYQNTPNLFTLMDLRMITRPYNQPDVAERSMLFGALSPYLGIDDMRWMFIESASIDSVYRHNAILMDYVLNVGGFDNIQKYGTEFRMPIYIINGEMDFTCPTALAREFYEEIDAPDKAFYEIKGCGHTPQGDRPEEVADIIKNLETK